MHSTSLYVLLCSLNEYLHIKRQIILINLHIKIQVEEKKHAIQLFKHVI